MSAFQELISSFSLTFSFLHLEGLEIQPCGFSKLISCQWVAACCFQERQLQMFVYKRQGQGVEGEWCVRDNWDSGADIKGLNHLDNMINLAVCLNNFK